MDGGTFDSDLSQNASARDAQQTAELLFPSFKIIQLK
jgi:hypothetical protein